MDAKNADVVFKAFAGADLPDAKLRQAMIDDVVGMLDYYTWTAPSGIASLFTSELSFARDARLAKLYGVPAWDGTGDAARAAGRAAPGPADARAVPVDRQREHAPDHEGRVPAHRTCCATRSRRRRRAPTPSRPSWARA